MATYDKTIDISDISAEANDYKIELEGVKLSLKGKSFWYPYDTLNNFNIIDLLLKGNNRRLFNLIKDGIVADVGAGDGEISFFLERYGFDIDAIDHAPTNFNLMEAIYLLKKELDSKVSVHDIDLDANLEFPRKRYDFVFFLGILYHLKNPYGVLEKLSQITPYCILSTRITRYDDGGSVNLSGTPVAYLTGSKSTNNDDTVYWIFSETGLKRILERTGWEILDFLTLGNTTASDPITGAGDERAYCLLRSRRI
jgi:tRNA (mo5U34)-methyltransferase